MIDLISLVGGLILLLFGLGIFLFLKEDKFIGIIIMIIGTILILFAFVPYCSEHKCHILNINITQSMRYKE